MSVVRIAGSTREVEKLREAVKELESADIGQAIADTIRECRTQVHFVPLEDDAIAQFNSATNEIAINAQLRGASPRVLAVHLAHEGTHLQLREPGSAVDALDQEYRCYQAQARVWNALKGSEKDAVCDDVVAMIAKGEAEAKAEIWQRYEKEYWMRWDRS